MKLYVRDGKIQPASLFKFIFVGVLLGEGLIFGIPFLLMSAAMLSSGVPVEGNIPPQLIWLFPLVFPLIVFMHALMFGGMIVLGLWVFSRFGKLEVADER